MIALCFENVFDSYTAKFLMWKTDIFNYFLFIWMIQIVSVLEVKNLCWIDVDSSSKNFANGFHHQLPSRRPIILWSKSAFSTFLCSVCFA